MKRHLALLLVLFGLFLPVRIGQSQTPENENGARQGEVAEPEEPDTLELFGAHFFQHVPSGEALPTGGALPDDYRLGPGDRLGIFLGGKVQEHFDAPVSTDGKIYLPSVGVLAVQGKTLAQFRVQLNRELAQFYSNYSLTLMLAAPKNVRVSVIGEVNAPGHYTLSALHTVMDAVLLARSPTPRGALRDIQLFRGDSLHAHIDLYQFLLQPQSRIDLFLQNGDQIYIPLARRRIQATGEVHRPAVYELCPQKQERLSDILELAGGLTPLAFTDKIELSRLQKDGSRRLHYFDASALGGDGMEDPPLEHDDRIHVYSLKERNPLQAVTVYGEVNEPGEYELEQNMHVSDLVLRAGSLKRSAYLLEAEVAKVEPNTAARTIRIDLRRALERPHLEEDLLLEADDMLFIRRIPDWHVGAVVEVRGQVRFPGFYTIVEDSTRLSGIIGEAGGLTEKADVREAKLIRPHAPPVEDKEFERLQAMTRDQMSDLEYEYYVMKQNAQDMREIVVDFEALMQRSDRREDVLLQPGDIIEIPEQSELVLVSGRVSRPGGLLCEPGAGVSYYIDKAGGFSWDADPAHTKVIKISGEIVDDEDVEALSSGDRIWVPRKPDRNYWQIFRDVILVAGQVATIYLVIHNAVK